MDACDMASHQESTTVQFLLDAHQSRMANVGTIVENAKGERCCEDCDKVIPQRRLSVLPNATRCVACQEFHENGINA